MDSKQQRITTEQKGRSTPHFGTDGPIHATDGTITNRVEIPPKGNTQGPVRILVA